jgi:Flp pilus assembly protein TadD
LYVLQAQLFLQTKQADQAQASLTRAVELDNQNILALALLAQLQSARGQPEQAIGNYQRAIALTPNDVALHNALGSAYESIGNWQQAETTYQKALALQPENALASNNLAYLMLEHGGSVNVALTLAQNARKGLPNLPNSADTLGWAYYHNGAFSSAAPLFEEAVEKVPSNLAYRYHLGLTYQKLNETVQARTQFDKIIELDPKSPLADQARQALSSASSP